jgi:hypothetical protein
MPTCHEVAQLVASGALASSGWRQRMTVRLHVVMCVHCRRYVAQLRRMGDAVRDLGRGSPEDSLSAARVMDRLRAQWKGGAQ